MFCIFVDVLFAYCINICLICRPLARLVCKYLATVKPVSLNQWKMYNGVCMYTCLLMFWCIARIYICVCVTGLVAFVLVLDPRGEVDVSDEQIEVCEDKNQELNSPNQVRNPN